MSFDLTEYQVGDEFETSPHDLGRIISAILAEEGSFTYEGNSITITSLPKRKLVEPVVEVPEEVEEVEEEVVVKAPKPVVEEEVEEVVLAAETIPAFVTTRLPEPVVEEVVSDPEVAIAPKPKGRPRKVVTKAEIE